MTSTALDRPRLPLPRWQGFGEQHKLREEQLAEQLEDLRCRTEAYESEVGRVSAELQDAREALDGADGELQAARSKCSALEEAVAAARAAPSRTDAVLAHFDTRSMKVHCVCRGGVQAKKKPGGCARSSLGRDGVLTVAGHA